MRTRNIRDAVCFQEDRLSKVNLFETRRFFCDLYCLRPGQSQKVHAHADNDKIYYIQRGQGRVTVGDESKTLMAGEIVLAAAGEPHGIENAADEDLVCLVFMAPHPSFERA